MRRAGLLARVRPTVRAVAGTLALAGLLGLATGLSPLSALPASAATSTDPARIGLFGGQDPTYDGAYRQSLALLALAAAGVDPAPEAVAWLLDQQCADGGWQAFRADLAAPCTAPDSTTYSGTDTNSTGLAVQALAALGEDTAVADGLAWLAAHQSPDGGFAYYPDGTPGNDPDANSTALALSAFRAAGATPPASTSGATPADALLALQVGCAGAPEERGAFTFFGSANDFATVQAALAIAGGFLPAQPATTPDDDAPELSCPPARAAAASDAALAASSDVAAGYLVRRLTANGSVIPDPFTPGATDYGTTANAVLALAVAGHGTTAAQAALAALAEDVDAFAVAAGADLPGALALLTLAAAALDADPTAFGGADLLARLQATLTTAAPSPTPTPTPSSTVSVAPSRSPAPAPAVVQGEQLAATGVDDAAGLTVLVGLLLIVGGAGVLRLARGRNGRG